MKKFVSVFLVGVVLGLVAGFEPREADAAPQGGAVEVESSKDLPKSGVLSSSGMGGPRGWTVPEPWGGVDAQGSEASPISGSVSRKNAREWVMRVFNNSSDPYAVTVQVKFLSPVGSALKTETYSYTLKGTSSTERALLGPVGVSEGQLSLVSWKNLAPKTDGDAKAAKAAKAP